ncbi:MAG: hypothetical protein HKN07_16120 [Acidimicrobiia bacterium]|nr:hypothetical protein [Acidimicrobiia bacterium]
MNALAAARALLNATRVGDEQRLWQLFSPAAKGRIIDVGEQQGLPADVAGRLRTETASAEEMDAFLVDVLEGIRRDLEWSTLSRLDVELMNESEEAARVALVEPLAIPLPGTAGGLPAAWLTLSPIAEIWLIDDIELPSR